MNNIGDAFSGCENICLFISGDSSNILMHKNVEEIIFQDKANQVPKILRNVDVNVYEVEEGDKVWHKKYGIGIV